MKSANSEIVGGLAEALVKAVDVKVARPAAKQRKRAPRRGVSCWFCGGDVGDDGFLIIGDEEMPPRKRAALVRFRIDGGREERGQIVWPGNGEDAALSGRWGNFRRVAVFAHVDCGPEDGIYYVPFDRLRENWEWHLRHKKWWFSGIADMLSTARAAFGVRRVVRDHEKD